MAKKSKEARRRSYEATKAHPDRYARHIARSRESSRRNREWLAAYKLAQGCVDCGYSEHAAALQLDHEGPKTAAISELRSSIARMKEEIERGQCKVRCANCHAVKTWREKQPVAVAE